MWYTYVFKSTCITIWVYIYDVGKIGKIGREETSNLSLKSSLVGHFGEQELALLFSPKFSLLSPSILGEKLRGVTYFCSCWGAVMEDQARRDQTLYLNTLLGFKIRSQGNYTFNPSFKVVLESIWCNIS